MSVPISVAPSTIAGNASKELEFTMREYLAMARQDDMPAQYAPNGNKLPPCQKLVRIGLFFDGTSNNKYRDEPSRNMPTSSSLEALFNLMR